MFGVEKPIIALLHLDALPGDPGYCGSMDTVLEHARQGLPEGFAPPAGKVPAPNLRHLIEIRIIFPTFVGL